MEFVKMENYRGKAINIYRDEDPENPRECDNLGKMVCFHKRYTLGDKHHPYSSDDYESWEELKEAICDNEDVAVILDLFLYDHSGLRIKIGDFYGLLPQGHARFDSGKVGFIYATKEDIRKEFSVKRISKMRLQFVEKLLRKEVENYAYYLSDDMYGYTTVLDTYNYWGFCGIDDALQNARESIDYVIKLGSAK